MKVSGPSESLAMVSDAMVGCHWLAVDSGLEAAQRGTVVTSLVIARPHNDICKKSLPSTK